MKKKRRKKKKKKPLLSSIFNILDFFNIFSIFSGVEKNFTLHLPPSHHNYCIHAAMATKHNATQHHIVFQGRPQLWTIWKSNNQTWSRNHMPEERVWGTTSEEWQSLEGPIPYTQEIVCEREWFWRERERERERVILIALSISLYSTDLA